MATLPTTNCFFTFMWFILLSGISILAKNPVCLKFFFPILLSTYPFGHHKESNQSPYHCHPTIFYKLSLFKLKSDIWIWIVHNMACRFSFRKTLESFTRSHEKKSNHENVNCKSRLFHFLRFFFWSVIQNSNLISPI